ncbi:Alpha-ketoglutarate-dependent dioxygenase alkB-like 6 [Porphyridium purpureum]|uniref:Alpha-ketoglutarate-dependent dioxygenase alkB-like 6 n=1 Tax=Porphyridium purpureum TaxID=35688 RepID=A0A5J4YNU0_PORPP|nr:Alpha-ketoglutarate-dependent dioxygenase alkB-like 6 [Porphyridium purpureum]|eukprot:POR6504..scf295_9
MTGCQALEIDGLVLYANVISEQQEVALVDQLDARRWKEISGRRVQTYGGLPHEKGMVEVPLPDFLQRVCSVLTSAEIEGERGRLNIFDANSPPNHVLVNEYQPGQGIQHHVDGPCYEPVAAIISLGADTQMTFKTIDGKRAVTRVDLERRSCLVMSGDAYVQYMHGIEPVMRDCVASCEKCTSLQHEGETNDHHESCNECEYRARARRVSLTIRRAKKRKGFGIKLSNT